MDKGHQVGTGRFHWQLVRRVFVLTTVNRCIRPRNESADEQGGSRLRGGLTRRKSLVFSTGISSSWAMPRPSFVSWRKSAKANGTFDGCTHEGWPSLHTHRFRTSSYHVSLSSSFAPSYFVYVEDCLPSWRGSPNHLMEQLDTRLISTGADKKNGGLYSPAPMAWIKTTLTYIRRQQVMKERPVDIATIATIRGPRVGMSSGAL